MADVKALDKITEIFPKEKGIIKFRIMDVHTKEIN